jgi:hypothetical protein
MHHVMSRGDQREDIFFDAVDRHDFIKTLTEACQNTGWQVHATQLNLEQEAFPHEETGPLDGREGNAGLASTSFHLSTWLRGFVFSGDRVADRFRQEVEGGLAARRPRPRPWPTNKSSSSGAPAHWINFNSACAN